MTLHYITALWHCNTSLHYDTALHHCIATLLKHYTTSMHYIAGLQHWLHYCRLPLFTSTAINLCIKVLYCNTFACDWIALGVCLLAFPNCTVQMPMNALKKTLLQYALPFGARFYILHKNSAPSCTESLNMLSAPKKCWQLWLCITVGNG